MMIVLDESSLLKCVIILNLNIALFRSMGKLLDEVFHLLLNKVYTGKHLWKRRDDDMKFSNLWELKSMMKRVKRRCDKIEFFLSFELFKIVLSGVQQKYLGWKILAEESFQSQSTEFTFTTTCNFHFWHVKYLHKHISYSIPINSTVRQSKLKTFYHSTMKAPKNAKRIA